MLRLTTQSPCARYIHGERVIFPPIPLLSQDGSADERKMVMLMLDFNVHPKRVDDPVPIAQGPWGEEERKYEVVDKERATDPENVFQYPIVSRLPYAVLTRQGLPDSSDYSGFMIDQDRLIAMRVSRLCD